ncbi:MAG: phage portal protein [Phycisphaeraceae bacterium]|nr:MAG: phage portal protein [Phycisphaeraceae bacterium]
MPDRLEGIEDVGLDEAFLRLVIDEHRRGALPRLDRLWTYFRDPGEPVGASGGSGGPRRWRTGQAQGLPERFRADPLEGDEAKEIVIENDIAWRVQTMVDFMFGKPVQILSTASDAGVRRAIEVVLDAVWEASGGIGLLQDTALLGHVFGYVDLLVRIDEGALIQRGSVIAALESGARDALAGLVRIEPVEPRRGIPVVSADDYRRLDAYVIHLERGLNEVEEASGGARMARLFGRRGGAGGVTGWKPLPRGRGEKKDNATRRRGTVTEVIGSGVRVVYHDNELVRRESSVLLPGVVPVVHIQNLSQPFRYEGLGEVEPLIGLQDELNTRLSDRASRVTMSSFKMYLAKRLDGFETAPVGPGRVWVTDDPDASIEAFGGDTSSPSESEHIEQIREAMDKVSGVPPLAGGVVRAKIGNLSSANALRITLMSLLAKTARKRVTYGAGIERVCRMVLTALDAAGVLRTHPADRGVRLVWPDPQPIDPTSALVAARQKVELGVDESRVLAELGYGPSDAGVS